jgi:hypothetical protein
MQNPKIKIQRVSLRKDGMGGPYSMNGEKRKLIDYWWEKRGKETTRKTKT